MGTKRDIFSPFVAATGDLAFFLGRRLDRLTPNFVVRPTVFDILARIRTKYC